MDATIVRSTAGGVVELICCAGFANGRDFGAEHHESVVELSCAQVLRMDATLVRSTTRASIAKPELDEAAPTAEFARRHAGVLLEPFGEVMDAAGFELVGDAQKRELGVGKQVLGQLRACGP